MIETATVMNFQQHPPLKWMSHKTCGEKNDMMKILTFPFTSKKWL